METKTTTITEPVELWDNRLYGLLKRKFKADRIRTKYIEDKDMIVVTLEYKQLNCKFMKYIYNIHDLIINGKSQETFVRELYETVLNEQKSLLFR